MVIRQSNNYLIPPEWTATRATTWNTHTLYTAFHGLELDLDEKDKGISNNAALCSFFAVLLLLSSSSHSSSHFLLLRPTEVPHCLAEQSGPDIKASRLSTRNTFYSRFPSIEVSGMWEDDSSKCGTQAEIWPSISWRILWISYAFNYRSMIVRMFLFEGGSSVPLSCAMYHVQETRTMTTALSNDTL